MAYIKHNKTPMKIKRQPKSDSVYVLVLLSLPFENVRFVLQFLDIKIPSIEVKSNETNNSPKMQACTKDEKEWKQLAWNSSRERENWLVMCNTRQENKMKWYAKWFRFCGFSEYGRNYENEIHLKTWRPLNKAPLMISILIRCCFASLRVCYRLML